MNLKFRFTNVRKHTVFIKFLGNMFMILIIPFLILLIMYSGLNLKIKDQTYERNLGILENSVQKIELLFDNMDQIAFYLNDNVNIVNYYNVDSRSMKSKISYMIKAQKDLATMKVGNNDILDIQLYSVLSDTLIDNFTNVLYFERYYGSSFYLKGLSYQQFRKEYLEQKANLTYRYGIMTANGMTNEVLVYNRYQTGTNFEKSNNRIIFYVSKDRMLQFFSPLEYQEDGFVYMLDKNGQVLLSNNPANYDIKQIDSSIFKSDSGYTSLNIDGRKMFVTYYRSKDRDWLCLEGIPASRVLSVTNGFRAFMLCLLILSAIVGSMLVLLIARKLSKPIIEASDILGHQEKKVHMEDFVYEIKRLVEHNTSLMEKMQQQISVMRTEAFCKLLTGECSSEVTIKEVLDKIGIRKEAAFYVILIVTCNDINMDAQLEDISAQKVFLDNMIRQQDFPEIQDIYHIDFERMIILLASDDLSAKRVRERAERLVTNVMGIIAQNIFYSISVGGDMVDDALKLPKAFMHAQRALNIPQNVFGVHKVQWYARAKQYLEMEVHELGIQDEDYISLQNLVIIEKIKEYINGNYNDPQLSLTSVGEEFCITEVYLSKLFKRATGENFSKYIEALRLKHAKELMDQNKRVTEVADLVGYNSPQVFRRAWKRYYGGTPTDNLR
ncbi:MAG: AraC family transcriptional regulator [Anaerocolumna sp.]